MSIFKSNKKQLVEAMKDFFEASGTDKVAVHAQKDSGYYQDTVDVKINDGKVVLRTPADLKTFHGDLSKPQTPELQNEKFKSLHLFNVHHALKDAGITGGAQLRNETPSLDGDGSQVYFSLRTSIEGKGTFADYAIDIEENGGISNLTDKLKQAIAAEKESTQFQDLIRHQREVLSGGKDHGNGQSR